MRGVWAEAENFARVNLRERYCVLEAVLMVELKLRPPKVREAVAGEGEAELSLRLGRAVLATKSSSAHMTTDRR
ncbi:MAG: hypothetical protein ACRD4R_08050 [Candidatus Acidiferrales bacterium]